MFNATFYLHILQVSLNMRILCWELFDMATYLHCVVL